jgi:NAD(P)H-nitrite reductase large subunit
LATNVIIGSGVAGFSAAEALSTIDPSAEILQISDDPHGFYSRPGLAYYLNGELPEKQLFPFPRNGKSNQNVQHVEGHVTRLDPASHQIEINGSGTISYDHVLLATGATAVPLNVPGEGLRGIVKLDDLEDTRNILALAKHNRTAVVVGGGVVGLELVEGLVARGVKVHYLIRSERYWQSIMDETESHSIEHHLVHAGVKLHYHSEIKEVLCKRGRVIGVRTSAGEDIRCGLVAVGIGVRPRMELAKAADLKTERGILVNEYLQTSDPDIYAAGDVAQIFDPSSGNSSIDNLWYPARKQGRIAAMNMSGQRQVYHRTVAVNVLRLAGVMTTIIGAIGSGRDDDGQVYTARGSSETWLQLPNTLAMESGNELSHVRLMVGEQNLLGALVMGDQKISRPLREMVNARVDISPIRMQLLKSGASLGQIVIDFWIKTKTQ